MPASLDNDWHLISSRPRSSRRQTSTSPFGNIVTFPSTTAAATMDIGIPTAHPISDAVNLIFCASSFNFPDAGKHVSAKEYFVTAKSNKAIIDMVKIKSLFINVVLQIPMLYNYNRLH
jgi:hypothetical protein